MASEVGSAYVSILPSAKGFASNLQREIGTDLARAGKTGGDDYGKQFSTAAAARAKRADVTSGVGSDARRAGAQAGEEYGKAFEKEAVDQADSAASGMSDKLKVGLAAGGALAGGAVIAGVGEALDRGRLSDKLAAQLGGGAKTRRATKVAADLFNGAWGDSVEDVNDAIGSVVTNIGGMRHATQRDLKSVSIAVLDIATAFDQDASAVTRAADQLVRTDLAKGPREALDIITKGFQSGANEADDLLDTYTEYGTQFRKLGLDGKEATGLLTQGLKAGARDADVVADAFKEFSIRAVDGSDLTQQSFNALGLSAEDMEEKIGKGGKSAADATDLVLDRLRKVKDPADRAQIAVGLFGTQSEDLGDALFALDPSNAVDTLGKVGGAAKRMGKTLNNNASTELESFKRTMQSKFVNFLGNEVIPAAKDLWEDVGPDVKKLGGTLGDMVDDVGPAVKDALPVVADVVGDVARAFGAFGKAFSSLPKPLQTAIITAALAGYGAKKLRGVTGGGLIPSIAMRGATPAVTGTVAAEGAVAAGAGAATRAGALRAGLGKAGLAGAGLFAGYEVTSALQEGEAAKIDALGKSLRNMSSFGLGKLPDDMNDLHDTIERLTSGAWQHKLERAAGSYDEESDEVKNLDGALVQLADQRGVPAAEKAFRVLARSQGLSKDETKHLLSILPQYKKLIGTSGTAALSHAKALDAAHDAGWDLLGLWRQNLIPSTKNLSDKFGLTTKEANLLRLKLSDTTGTAKQHENQLRQVAKQLGLDQDETRDLIKAYGDIPKKVETRAEFLTSEAERKRDQFLKDTKGKFSDLGNDTYAIMVDGQSGHGRITTGAAFDVGGWTGPGPKHRPVGLVHADEFVTRKESRGKMERRFPGYLDYINEHGTLPGFDDGGRVNTKVNMDLSELRALVRETVKSLKSAGGSVPATLAWAKRQVGDPYLMGGTGPNAWDCSGFMSGITNHLMGRNPYHRLFATSSFPTSMFARGPGTFMIGSTRDAGGGIGHMAGTLGGVNVESSGDVGVHMGSSARGARDPLFGGNIWHLKPGLITRLVTGGGRGDVGAQGGLSAAERWIIGHEAGSQGVHANNPTSSAFGLGQLLSSNRVAYAKRLGLNWHRELGDTGTTSYDAQLAMMRMYIKDRYGSAGAAKNFWLRNGYYDTASDRTPGVLKPGYTLAYNGTGRDEYVTKDRPQRRSGPQRIVLDAGSIGRLSGWIDDRIDGALDFEAGRA